ncbi:MAG TPA: hypothetical protein VHM02_16060, partial [Thermoanaerobaculia bacterium]|nr:hypothetical protein [Thermoanaerobaculia bacterium]
ALAVLAVALALRLPLLVLPPTLSDDALRYLWDGRVLLAGENPWALPPDAGELAPLRDDLWQRLPHRQVPTVYPPLALAGFSIAAALPWPLAAWKGMVAAAELAACAALVGLARRRGLPPARAAWYAWCPLPALEVAGMGHVDGLAVAAAVGAVWALSGGRAGEGAERDRTAAGGAALAAAGVLAKLAPAAALPMWARASGRPLVFLLVAASLTVAGLAPVAIATGGLPPGLMTYGLSWEFAGPLYEPLWRLLDAAGADVLVADLLDRAKLATGRHDGLNRLYPFVYPQLLAKLLLAGLALAVVARSAFARDPVAGGRRLFGGLLLCSATVYPWYLLWALPWAALTRHRPWLLAAALAPLLYLPQHAGVALFPAVWAAVWGPPAALAAADVWRRRTAAR